MTCQCRFISSNKYTTLAGSVIKKDGYSMGTEGIGENSIPSPRFCCQLKTALKKKILIKKKKENAVLCICKIGGRAGLS